MFHAQLTPDQEICTGMAQFQPKLEANADSNVPTTPPAPQKSLRFIVGTALMAGSFFAYPAYPAILLWLPLSVGGKAGVSVAVWVLSWGTFSLGAFLARPEGYLWFKLLWRRLTAMRSRNQ